MNKSYNKGLTIVETLVAVAILMIAIAGPMSVASKSLSAAKYAKDQAIATYLAQEAIELIYNLKANNISNATIQHLDIYSEWLKYNSLNTLGSSSFCDLDYKCGISVNEPAPYEDTIRIDLCTSLSNCLLSTDGNGYQYSPSSATATKFTRYFYISAGSSDAEKTVNVVVNWTEGIIPYSLTVSEQIAILSR